MRSNNASTRRHKTRDALHAWPAGSKNVDAPWDSANWGRGGMTDQTSEQAGRESKGSVKGTDEQM